MTEALIDVEDTAADEDLDDMFPQVETYENYLLGHVGVVEGITVEQVGDWTKVTGTIRADDKIVLFKKKAVKKYEFDPVTGGTKFVRQYRRLYENTPVTFELKWDRGRWRAPTVVVWEPSEFEKIERQMLHNHVVETREPFVHQFVRKTIIKNLKTLQTPSEEEILWEGSDLNVLRRECPRNDKKWYIQRDRFRPLTPEEHAAYKEVYGSRLKIRVTQSFRYYDPFSKSWVDCLDPR